MISFILLIFFGINRLAGVTILASSYIGKRLSLPSLIPRLKLRFLDCSGLLSLRLGFIWTGALPNTSVASQKRKSIVCSKVSISLITYGRCFYYDKEVSKSI